MCTVCVVCVHCMSCVCVLLVVCVHGMCCVCCVYVVLHMCCFILGVVKAVSQGVSMLQLMGKGRQCGRAPTQTQRWHATSAYVSPVRTQSGITPSCKGGWECIRLQFRYRSRTDLGSSCRSGYHIFFLCSPIHPHFPCRARPYSIGVL